MSLEKDPCKNFYEFACGLWDQANPPNGLNDEWQTMGKMEALLLWNLKELLEEGSPGDSSTMTGRTKMFHKGCMNLPTRGAEATKPLLDILDSLGGFPMISPLSDRADGKPYAFDWQEAVIKLRQLSFANYPLDTYVYLDAVDATKHLTYVEETSLGMPEYVLLGDPSSQDLYDYQEYMYFAATFLRDSRAKLYNTSASNVPDDNAVWSAITTILQFETDLANITLPYAVKQSLPASAQYNVFTIKTLQNLTDSALLPTEARARLNWTRYFRSMFEPAGVSLTPEDKIIISNPDYLQDLVSLIVAYDDETIANYLMMRFILAVGPETTQRFQTYERTFQKRHHYNTQRPRDRRKTWNLPGSRTEQCVGKTNTLLGRSLGAMYVAEFFNEDAKKDLLEMAELIRAALIDEINAARWMDNKTTTYAIEKAKAMKVNMAYPDWIMSNGRPNEAALLEFYKNVQITEENHFQNVMNLYDLEVKNDARLLRQAPDKNIWITKPAVVNAFYSPSHNAMYFPAGFLQPPFYHLGLSVAAVNYGAFGGVIGHEIIHGFDKSGSTYDKDGSLINWWTNTTRIEYEKKTECFVEQYGNLKVFGLSDSADCSTLQINGEMTLDENMADNGGVRIAYNAFLARERKSPSNLRLPAMAKYTPSQLFFISHATSVCGIVTKESLASDLMSDEHAPWASRVVGTLQNMPEFSEAFGCIPRDPMNPVEKCTVW